jgi:hypothetical protein
VAADPAREITSPWSLNGRIARLLAWTPLVLAGAYLIALAVQFGQIVAATYLDADAASAPVIGELYGGSPLHRDVVLGQMAWFSTLMFELATRWLPAHRQIWEAAPYAMALASAALIAWGLWRVAGRWAATIGGTIVVCAAPHTLHLLFSLNDHSPTWFSLALLAGLLVLAQSRAGELGALASVLVAIVVGAIVGANMASDTLLIGAGVVPALLAAAGAYALSAGTGAPPDASYSRPRRRALLLTLATLAVAVIADVLTRLFMHHENVTIPAGITNTGLAGAQAVTSNFHLWWQSIAVLGNGEFFGQALGFTSSLQLLCAGLSILTVAVLVPRIAWRELHRAARAGRRGAQDEHGPDEAEIADERTDALGVRDARAMRLAWCIFWGSSATLLSIGFIVSSTPVDINSDRYLVGLVYTGAALVPLAAGRSALRRAAISIATSVFAFTGLLTLAQGGVAGNPGKFPSDSVSAQVARIARREHLTVGYAGYWDAASITWATHLAVKVYPVYACGTQLCPFYIHYISSWYTPRSGMRTFLISDPTQPVAAPPVSALGTPSAIYRIDELTMYVYPYDIAGRLQ